MLNKAQIKLVQTAVRAAGLRGKGADGRYRLLLNQFLQSDGRPVTSCKQLNNIQLEDLLAICESYGWRMPGKAENHFRRLRCRHGNTASYAQQRAIGYLKGDLGWDDLQLGGFLKRQTGGFVDSVVGLSSAQAYKVIEGLKAILGRPAGKQYNSLKDVQADMEVNNGEEGQTSKVG